MMNLHGRFPIKFNDAVTKFIDSLSSEETKHFLSLDGVNPHSAEGARYWVISRDFGIQGQKNIELLKDIAKENSDKPLSMDFMAEIPDEFYAVTIILEKAREVLNNKNN